MCGYLVLLLFMPNGSSIKHPRCKYEPEICSQHYALPLLRFLAVCVGIVVYGMASRIAVWWNGKVEE